MIMENFIVAGILIVLIGTVIFYLVREKKKGRKCIGMSLGISTNLEAVTAQYVNVRLERKRAVLETYHKALHPQKPTPDKGSEPKKAKKKSSEIEL